jgi:hypothetical protein
MASSADQSLFTTRSSPLRPRSRQKSAISNGTRLLPGTDNRGPWVRRCRDIMADLTSDRGGASELSAAEASLIRRAAVLSVELEALEVKFAEAGQATDRDLDLYSRTVGNLRRVLETLGVRRDPSRARNIQPLADILAQLDREPAAAESGSAE